ncbi:MAG: hypothetical protein BGO95_04465 [Micrococcales bacterium 73-13]|nr:MAG: hypothetical protein BGO95_04465 [Micrococcales bacterium 73-13]
MRRAPLAAALLAGPLLAVALLSGCSVGTTSAPTATPTPTETTTPFTSVEAGDCYDTVDRSSVQVVDCDRPHGFEVFASLLLDDAEYPGTTISDAVAARCKSAFATFVGVEFDASALSLRTVAPSQRTWEQGDREVLCVVFDPAARTSGSLAGSAR